ncbi:MAG: 4Fe-4S dicluster domain-containing protein [Candidatus Omnitrophica bacterium]|nr:4Fe-4S dicluster domain-containing protein [Candidatus Omnitrophota bacterium]
MDRYVTLKKTSFNDFIAKLATIEQVVAPVSKGYGQYAFEPVTGGESVAVKHLPTILPPKKYFMPQREDIVAFNKKEHSWTPLAQTEKMAIFGVHTCDLAGIQELNMVFNTRPRDMNYLARKNKIAIIGIECNEYCDEYASCHVMENHLPKGGYDLFFTDIGEAYIVHVNTQIGDGIIGGTGLFAEASDADHKKLEQLREAKRKIFKNEVKVDHQGLKPLFEKSYESKVWDDLDKRCVSCGNCTNVCPTCYCFDMKDEIDLDLNAGTRTRVWDSCQSEEFAEVSGGENFREERGARQRHRYMRKFNYPVTRYSRYFCTGCGRCSRTCMAKINLKETINALAEDKS